MVYQAILEQKAQAQRQKLMQQQAQAMQKQQQAFEKWVKAQKARKDKDQPVDPHYQQMLDREAQYKAQLEARAAKRKPTKTRAKR